MHGALYHPETGYYSSRVRGVGRRGDFSTWATLDHSLAKAVAGWIRGRRIRRLIEVGAGDGSLALAVLKSLGWWRRLGFQYHIVEVSEPLREAQQKLLNRFGVVWHSGPAEALRALNGRASIFSNELPDAFPCRVFEKCGDGWLELHVQNLDGAQQECLMPCQLPASTVFAYRFLNGARVEVHESYRCWLHGWAQEWRCGEMLTIDYGDTMPGLYHRRPAGTLRAYLAHQRITGAGVLERPGTRDITADVNFSDLEKWGSDIGWQTLGGGTLEEFFRKWMPGMAIPGAFHEASHAFRFLEQCTGR